MKSVWKKNGKIVMRDGKVILCESCPCETRIITISGCIDHLEYFWFTPTSIRWEHNPEWDWRCRRIGAAEPGMHWECAYERCNGIGMLGYPWVLVNGKLWNLNAGDFQLPFVITGFVGEDFIRIYDPASSPHCLSESIEVFTSQYDNEEFE